MTMIGWVEFREGAREMRAVLRVDGLWVCDDAPAVTLRLNRDFTPPAPAAGEMWGYDQLVAAAIDLRGIAWLGPDLPRTSDGEAMQEQR
jgi:hypothetical protein